MSELLVVTGPVGVGKTTVAREIAELLDERGETFGFFDLDAVHFRPVPDDDPFGYRVALAALDAAWALMGADRLVVPMIVESRDDLAHFAGWEVAVVRLAAPLALIEERIRARELGAGLEWHLARASELEAHWRARPVEDALVDAARPVREVALDVLAAAGWR